MTNDVAIVLQARMGSTRLPGKSLAPIAGKSILQHCIERLRARAGMPVILATTKLAEDDVLAAEATRLGAPVVRGSETDVLDRFVQAIEQFELRYVIRATADNPAVDMNAPRRTLQILQRTGASHVVEHGLPYGCAVEAIDAQTLRVAGRLATLEYDREHVTPFLRREAKYRALDALAPHHVRRPSLRFTVDTPEDLDFMRCVYACTDVASGPPDLEELITMAEWLTEVKNETAGAR